MHGIVAGLTGLLADREKALGQNDNLLARNVVLLQRLADCNLGRAVRVHVGRVPGVEASVVGGLEQRKCLRSCS